MRRKAHLFLAILIATVACGETATVESAHTTPDALREAGPSTTEAGAEEPVSTGALEHPANNEVIDLIWAVADLPDRVYVDELIVTADGYLAYNFGPTTRAWSSPDGLSWAEETVSLDTGIEVSSSTGIVSHDGGYVAIGGGPDDDHVLLTSTDGLTWTSQSIQMTRPERAEVNIESIQPTPAGGLILVGSDVVDDPAGGHHHRTLLWAPSDTNSWSLIPDPFGAEVTITEMSSTPEGLVAHGFIDGTDDGNRLWITQDGVSWERLGPGPASGEPYLAAWDDRLLMASYEMDQGFRLWMSDDAGEWTDLAPHHLLADTDDYRVFPHLLVAGSYGVVLLGEKMANPPPEPDVAVAKDGLTAIIHMETFSFSVVDDDSGELLTQGSLEGPHIRYEEDLNTVVFLDAETGEDLMSIDPEEFEQARQRTYDEQGIIPPEEREDQNVPTLWFSPDTERWAGIAIEDITGQPSWIREVMVGNESMLLLVEDAGGEPDDLLPEDNPGTIWVGVLND